MNSDLESIEDFWNTMDSLRLRMDSLSDEQIVRMKDLDAKHRAFYWRVGKTRGPEPSRAEILEYQRSIPIRLRAQSPAESRVFLAEHSPEERKRYFPFFEQAYTDIHTFQYAWIGMIMKEQRHQTKALYAVRSILVYAETLIQTRRAQKALCVLRLCQRAVHQLVLTMSQETGDDRFTLSIQEYKVAFYTSMALADLGRMDDSIESFREAAFLEQQHRFQGGTEYTDRHRNEEDDVIQSLENNVSVLYELSRTLNIPRLHLDSSFDINNNNPDDDDIVDSLEDAQIWRCIQTLGFGLNNNCNQEPMNCCPHCWTTNNAVKRNVCSRCRAVAYCNKECQKCDWKYHKEDCVPIRQDAAATHEMGGESNI